MSTLDLDSLKSDEALLLATIPGLIADHQAAQTAYAAASRGNDFAAINAALADLDNARETLDDANSDLDQIESEILRSEAQLNITNPDQTEADSQEKMSNSEIVGSTDGTDAGTNSIGIDGTISDNTADFGRTVTVPQGAQPSSARAATVKFRDARGNTQNADLRVKIRVPSSYLTTYTQGLFRELRDLGGIIFPYTPTIRYDHTAVYSPAAITHSNFPINFYKNSSLGSINIQGTFTVRNEKDAGVYLATIHLLRALTKMRSGGSTGDLDSGAPPPVCRLDAYGDFMMSNIPVAISSFAVDLPNDVDYFTLGKGRVSNAVYGLTSVPTKSSISITCVPMYSRAEMQKFSVTGWLKDAEFRKTTGYL